MFEDVIPACVVSVLLKYETYLLFIQKNQFRVNRFKVRSNQLIVKFMCVSVSISYLLRELR